MVICSFTKWRVPGDSELQESSTTAALSQKSQQYCLRLQVLSTDKMLEVGKATISGQSIDLMILCSSVCTAWCAKGGCSQPGPAQESLLCAPLPNHTLSDISLVAWSHSIEEKIPKEFTAISDLPPTALVFQSGYTIWRSQNAFNFHSICQRSPSLSSFLRMAPSFWKLDMDALSIFSDTYLIMALTILQ